MVKTPVGSVETLYPHVGDNFGQAMLVVLVCLMGFAFVKRLRNRVER